MNSTSILDLVDWLDLNKGWEVFLFLFFFFNHLAPLYSSCALYCSAFFIGAVNIILFVYQKIKKE